MLCRAHPPFWVLKQCSKIGSAYHQGVGNGEVSSGTLFSTLLTCILLFSLSAKKNHCHCDLIWKGTRILIWTCPYIALSSFTKGSHGNWLRMNEINRITIIWLCNCKICPGRLHSNCVSACWQLFALVTQQRPSYYGHHSNWSGHPDARDHLILNNLIQSLSLTYHPFPHISPQATNWQYTCCPCASQQLTLNLQNFHPRVES